MSHRNLLNAGFLVGERLGYSPRDRLCLATPLFGSTGMALAVLAATTHGSCLVMPREATSLREVRRCLSRVRCASLHAPAELFLELMSGHDDAVEGLPELRTGLLTGTIPGSTTLEELARHLGISELVQIFGLAEAASIACRSTAAAPRAGRAGRRRSPAFDHVAPHTELRIVDPQGRAVVPCGRQGELWVRGHSVMLGYWVDPQTTLSTVEPDGWLHTGVRARLDAQGRLWLAEVERRSG